jgi:hypothetical protein
MFPALNVDARLNRLVQQLAVEIGQLRQVTGFNPLDVDREIEQTSARLLAAMDPQ